MANRIKTVALLLIGLLFVASVAFSQEQRNEVSVDVGGPILAVISAFAAANYYLPFNISYERVIDQHWILSTTLAIYSRDSTSDDYYLKITPWVEMEWHPHLSTTGLGGFFVGPAVCLPIATDFFPSPSSDAGTSVVIGLGLSIGYQFVLTDSLSISVLARSAPIGYAIVTRPKLLGPNYYNGFVPLFLDEPATAEVTVGYRF